MDFSLLKTWQRFEELCKVLLNLEYEGIYGVVPNPGDRGIDSFSLNMILDGQLQIYQFKFFKGKLTGSQKQQIKNSLNTATTQNPVLWHLLTSAEFSMDDWDWWKSLEATHQNIEFKIWNHDKLEALVIKHQENLKMEFTELFYNVGIALELAKKFYENITNDLISLQMREANIEFLNLYSELTVGDKNCWKNGHFRMQDVQAGFDARREVIKRILAMIDSTSGVIIYGRAHYGKSVTLMRVAFEALERGFVTLYTDNLSANSIVLRKLLEHTLEKTRLKILFVADNVSNSNMAEIFRCYNNFKNNTRVKFLLASRNEEFDAGLSLLRPYDQREVKVALQTIREVNLSFTENDAEVLVKRSTQLWNVNVSGQDLKGLSKKFYEVCEDDPLTFTCIIISYLNNKLDPNNLADPFEYLVYDFEEKITALNSNPQLWNVAVHCLFLGGLGFRLIPEILKLCNITTEQIIELSNLGILFKNSEYKVRHGRWAIEFLLYICKKRFNLNFNEFNIRYAVNSLIESLTLQLDTKVVLILFARFSSLVGEAKFSDLTKNWVQFTKIPPSLSNEDMANLLCYGYGNFNLSSKEYSKSIQYFNDAIEKQPKHYASWNNKGNAYHSLEEYSLAKDSYDEAIKIEPQDSEPYYNKAKVLNDEPHQLNDSSKFQEALECIDLAISFDPLYQWNYFEKGNTLVNLKRDDEGVAYYYKTLSINPYNEGAWLNIARVLYIRKIYDYVKPFLDMVERINPRTPELWYYRGLLEIENGIPANGEELIMKAIDLDPNEFQYHTQMGIRLLQKSDFENAFKFLIDSYILNESDVVTLGNLSLCSMHLHRKCDALIYSAKAYINLSKPEDFDAFRKSLGQICLYIATVCPLRTSVTKFTKILEPHLLLIYLSTYIQDRACTVTLMELFGLI